MYKINLLDYKFSSLILIFGTYIAIIDDVSVYNRIFYLIVLAYSILQNFINIKFKKLFTSLIALISFYIQFILNDYTFSKEYFINLLPILLFLKFAEIEKKSDYYFFNYTCVFFGITVLIYGQDFVSSIISFLIIFISIIHLYSINQTKIISLNFKNLLRYLLFGLSIFPIIIIVYLVFPRTEINIKLFETKQNQLGIPDKISLGSFQNISDSDETVFIFSKENSKVNEKYYFRVKVFDTLNNEKDWIETPYNVLLNKYSKNIKINKSEKNNSDVAKLILFPTEKLWVPKNKNYSFEGANIKLNIFNNISSLSKINDQKKSFSLYYKNDEYLFDQNLLNQYLYLPDTLSPKLKEWVYTNKLSSKNERDFLNKILLEFKENNFYYSLTPKFEGNDYENFFFESKTGYCEYYAGTFAILARFANIPSRVVTGYFGGSYNNLGKFYTFKQQDAHSWAEVYLDGKWVRYDPTLQIPNQNILNSNNLNIEQNNLLEIEKTTLGDLNINKYELYFDYINYIWTNNFTRYDEKSRDRFIKEKLYNYKFLNHIFNILLLLIFSIFVIKFCRFIFLKKVLFNSFFRKIIKQNKISSRNMTHQEIFNTLSKIQKNKFRDIFELYENYNFNLKFKMTFDNFYKINLKILKYRFLNV